MSTAWFFECLDHDPPLRSADEFTQRTDDEHFKNAIRLAAERPVKDWRKYFGLPSRVRGVARSRVFFEENARHFLAKHPTCRLGIVNEYGERRSLDIAVLDGRKEEK